ncbi:MAG TPA: hypothetical protein VF530_12670 [Planctomycetota bacterium]
MRPIPFLRSASAAPTWLLAALLGLNACSGSSSSSNRPPAVVIEAPFTGNSFEEGVAVELTGSASDPEEGPLDGTRLLWSSDVDGMLGSGTSVTVPALSLGAHGIRLTATDSAGASASATVHVRVVEPPAATRRPGEVNPYAGVLRRRPVKLDDELILIGRASATDELLLGIVDVPIDAYDDPSSTPVDPRVSARRPAEVARAAAAGRVLDSAAHQAAVVLRPSAGGGPFRLELVGLADPGQRRAAELVFQPLFPDGALDVAVADLDTFEEVTGRPQREPPPDETAEYHDEVVLATADLLNGERVARLDVLSFEDVELPREELASVPEPTTVTTTWTTRPMHPASRIVVRHGDSFYGGGGPHLLVAYVDEQRRIAVDVFAYRHTRADPHVPDPRSDERLLEHVQQAALSAPLDEAAVLAGGWDLTVGRGSGLGIDALGTFDFVLLVHTDAPGFVQEGWKLTDLDGMPTPHRIGQASGEFARVPDLMGGEIGLRLLADTRVQISLGRIVDNVTNRCEALGLFVLADTNRGPVLQTMTAFVEDPFIGQSRFGPVNEAPVWPPPVEILARAESDQTTRTSLVAGGFVSRRNGLVDERRTAFPSEFARDCDDVATEPYLGRMPSVYVSETEAGLLHAVTTILGSTLGTGSVVSVPLPAGLDERPLLLAADATGDAAYHGSLRCVGPATQDCRRLFLGDAELHYAIEDVETTSVLLQQPPKHVDFLPELGGIVDVSMRDGFFAEFVQTDEASGSVTRKLKTDWSVGAKLGIGFGAPAAKDYESNFEMSLDYEHRSVQERFDSSAVTVRLTQTTGAVDDDVVWSKRQTIDFWRFPAQGGRPERRPSGDTGLPDEAWMEIAIPAEPSTRIGPGTLNDDYQPRHMVGNILSYPTFAGDADDLGELFGFLGSYVPSDESGTRQCKPLEDGNPNGCLVLVNGVAEQVAEVLAGDDFVGGEFERVSAPIDVAEELQVGGIAYSAELEFETSIKDGLTVTNNDTLKAEVKGKIPLQVKKAGVGLQFGEIETELRASASFENARVSENSVGSKTKIALRLPADIPVERSYRIRPSFGFSPGGGLRVSYQVSTEGAAAGFWERHYSAPDPALHLPHRIVRTAGGLVLGTDDSRGRMKGFLVRDGTDVDPQAPHRVEGPLVVAVPRAGDPLQLEVRVTNLSVASSVTDLDVLFAVQEVVGGVPRGPELPIGLARLDLLPHRGLFPDEPDAHVRSAYVVWDTSGFGPPPGQALATYRVRVTLDPDDRVRGETHELRDRRADPLRGPDGAVLDPGLEKGQNNAGWALLRLAPPLSEAATARGGSAARSYPQRAEAPVRLALAEPGASSRVRAARLHEPLALRVRLTADAPVLDHARLEVYDGDPAGGATRVLSHLVQGVAGEVEELSWTPRSPGRRVLHVVYVGPLAEGRPALQIPVVVSE